MNRHLLVALALLLAHPAGAADPPPSQAALEQRVKALEEQVAALVKSQAAVPAPVANPTTAKAQAVEVGNIKVTKWDYAPRDGEYGQSYYRITYTLANGYDKPIKLLKGSIRFEDLLGERVYTIALDQDVKLAPGKETNFRGDYRRNQFISEDARLAAMSKSDVVVKLNVDTVVFGDNTVLNLK